MDSKCMCDAFFLKRLLSNFFYKDDDDAGAHIFCSDGTLLQIEKGGKVSCTAATPVETAGFMIVA